MALLLVVLLNIFIKIGTQTPAAPLTKLTTVTNPLTGKQIQIAEADKHLSFEDGSDNHLNTKEPVKKKKKKRKRGNYSEIVFVVPPHIEPVTHTEYATVAFTLPVSPALNNASYLFWLQRGPPAC